MELKNIKVAPIDVEARKNVDIRPGDTVRVWQKIQEGEKSRLQAFEGVVLAKKHGKENGGTFTVRKVIDSVGVERIFPLYSPIIDEIEVLKRAKVRRSKLYFIREKAAKDIRKRMKSELLEARKESNTDTSEAKKVKEEVKKAEVEAKAEEKK
ncbi:MAG: 50S ribosomal protein L19 [Candidatus Paceibacterota bacterium]|jgi:large subunit ribosomal protein L19